MSPVSEDTLLEFPCQFPIKVMGKADGDLEAMIVTLIRNHVPDFGEGAVKTRSSSGGRYLAVTVTINATSRAQIDAIYSDLTDCDRVIIAL